MSDAIDDNNCGIVCMSYIHELDDREVTIDNGY